MSVVTASLPTRKLRPDEIDWDLFPEQEREEPMTFSAYSSLKALEALLDAIPDRCATAEMEIYDGTETASGSKFFLRPDLMLWLVEPVEPHDQTVHLQMEGVIPPEVVMELTSKSTRDRDFGVKVERYRTWGIDSYIIIDLQQKRVVVNQVDGTQNNVKADGSFIRVNSNLEMAWDGSEKGFRMRWMGRELLTLVDQAISTAHNERKRAETANKRADDADRLVNQERRRADEAEKRAEKLAAELRRLGHEPPEA